jgi:hypothetical protein
MISVKKVEINAQSGNPKTNGSTALFGKYQGTINTTLINNRIQIHFLRMGSFTDLVFISYPPLKEISSMELIIYDAVQP